MVAIIFLDSLWSWHGLSAETYVPMALFHWADWKVVLTYKRIIIFFDVQSSFV